VTVVAVQVLGFACSVISFVLFWPQVRRTWAIHDDPRDLAGVATGTQWLLLANAVGWGLYAVLTGAFWSGAPGLINGPLAIATLILIGRAQNRGNDDDCPLCVAGISHHVLITTPPGYGTLTACSSFARSNGVVVRDDQLPAGLPAVIG
jgi:uncharacterized protein with PQ loop repeat